MKKVLVSVALATAALIPTMSSANAACIHVANPPEVHVPECQAIPGLILADQHIGGCSFVAATDNVAGDGQMTGEIDVEAIVFSPNPAENPVTATFTCYILVNGAPQPGAVVTATGTVVVAGAGVVTYTSNSVTDFVQLCQNISYSNGVTQSECFESETFEFPPPLIWEIVDPLVCPVLAALAPLTIEVLPTPPGPTLITIEIRPGAGAPSDPGADVYINGELFYDCPAYQTT